MPTLEYFIIAESCSVDQNTNSLSLFHILEELHVPGLPFVLPQLVAVSSWNLADDEIGNEYQLLLRVHDPGQNEPVDFPLNTAAMRRRHRMMQTFIGFAFHSFGDIRFEVLIDGQHGANHIVSVHQVPQPEQAEPGQPDA